MTQKRILLLHGWGARVAKLKPLQNHLEKLGWLVKAAKLPGFDLQAPSKGWSLEDYADYVWGLSIKNFGHNKMVVFGHSFGGRIAIKMAKSGNAKMLAGMVLCAPGGVTRPPVVKRLIFKNVAKLGRGLALFPFAGGLFRKMLYKFAREHDYENTKGTMKLTFNNIIEENILTQVAKITTPTLILWGGQDRTVPVVGAGLLKNVIAKSQVVIFPDDGHKLPYLKPDEVAIAIDNWYKLT